MPQPKAFRGADYLKINFLFFALTALSQSLHSIILPVRVLDFVSDSQKNTFLGLMTFTGLLIAVLYQPIAGALSDRAHSTWGRRRPFVLLGIGGLILALAGVGLAQTYLFLFIAYCFMQFAGNTAQGPYQAFLPELAPPEKRGRASAVKNLMEVTGGAAMVGVTSVLIGRYQETSAPVWLWLALACVAATLLLALLLSLFWIKEPALTPQHKAEPLRQVITSAFRLDFHREKAFLRFLASRTLVLMALTTIQQFALYYFLDVVKVDNPATATFKFLGVALAVGVLVAYPAGYLSDRFSRQKISAVAAAMGAVSIGLIMLLSPNFDLLLIPAALMGAALVIFSITNWALAADLAVAGEEGRYLGLANMATAGGAALARLIGPAIDFFNARQANLGYDFMLGACVVYFTLGALILMNLKLSRKTGPALPNP